MKSLYVTTSLTVFLLVSSFTTAPVYPEIAKIVNKHHLEQTTYIKDATPQVIGPLPQASSYDPRYYSLATSRPDSFISFKEALGFKESQSTYWRVNSLGYMGKYQFGTSTLSLLGFHNTDAFLKSPKLQERAFIKNVRYNYEVLQPYIAKYAGKKIAGIEITESGIIAAAHLSGPGGVKRFFKTNGRKASRDAYGSSIKTYLKRFAGYNITEIIQS